MKDLIEQIKRLSARDTKTLTERAVKGSEEMGELSRAILPYVGARGTHHRLPSREKIIEECADLMLVALSIMNDLKADEAEITRMIQRKTDYWQFLLDNEDKTDCEALDFEIHITVADADSVEAFQATCRDIGVKPIILDLYTSGLPIKDVMTSSKFRGSTREVVRHSRDLAVRLQSLGYTVVREKIETVPWHPAAMITPPPHNYFEAHLAFRNTRDEVAPFASRHGLHLSRNAMKRGDGVATMGTIRFDASTISELAFRSAVDAIAHQARLDGLNVDPKLHTEYSLYDSCTAHDANWIAG